MTRRAELIQDYRAEDSRRLIAEPMFRLDADRIRQKLRYLDSRITIEYKCFNDAEAEMIREQLTLDERERVRFSWLFTIQENGG